MTDRAFVAPACGGIRAIGVALQGASPSATSIFRQRGAVSLKKARGAGRPGRLRFGWGSRVKVTVTIGDQEMDGAAALADVSKRYGWAVLVDLITILALAWDANRCAAPFWWWPAEHLHVQGIADTQDSRRELAGRVAKLLSVQLVKRAEDGAELDAPLITTVARASTGPYMLSLHPSLAEDVVGTAPALCGKWFWPLPWTLLSARSSRGYKDLPAFAVTLSHCFRAGVKRNGPFRISAARLARQLGIRQRADRRTDRRVEKRLASVLNQAVAFGLASGWTLERGLLGNLSGIVAIGRPEIQKQCACGLSRLHSRGLPQTRRELRQWHARLGVSVAATAAMLGLPERTLRRSLRLADEIPLPNRVRMALVCWVEREKPCCAPTAPSGQS